MMVPQINFVALAVFCVLVGVALAQVLPWVFRMLGHLLILVGGWLA